MRRTKHDPIANLEMYAQGDVVGLGLMSQKELDDKGKWNARLQKWSIKPGRERALDLIPTAMRFAAEKELAPFREAKKASTNVITGPDGQPLQVGPRVVFMLPPNGREKK